MRLQPGYRVCYRQIHSLFTYLLRSAGALCIVVWCRLVDEQAVQSERRGVFYGL